MDDIQDDIDVHTLYYKCSKCGKSESQLYTPGFGEPYFDCPFCGGAIVFESNCWTCGLLMTPYCIISECVNGSGYKQRSPQTGGREK